MFSPFARMARLCGGAVVFDRLSQRGKRQLAERLVLEHLFKLFVLLFHHSESSFLRLGSRGVRVPGLLRGNKPALGDSSGGRVR